MIHPDLIFWFFAPLLHIPFSLITFSLCWPPDERCTLPCHACMLSVLSVCSRFPQHAPYRPPV